MVRADRAHSPSNFPHRPNPYWALAAPLVDAGQNEPKKKKQKKNKNHEFIDFDSTINIYTSDNYNASDKQRTFAHYSCLTINIECEANFIQVKPNELCAVVVAGAHLAQVIVQEKKWIQDCEVAKNGHKMGIAHSKHEKKKCLPSRVDGERIGFFD